MGMGHIERGVDSAIEINDLLKVLSPLAQDLHKEVQAIIEEYDSSFGGQDVLPNTEAEISNLLVDYSDPTDGLTEEEFEESVTKQARTIKHFADIVEKETGLIIGLVFADSTNGDRYDDVSDVWVWFGCNLRETIDTEVGKALKAKGVHSSPVRWSDYG